MFYLSENVSLSQRQDLKHCQITVLFFPVLSFYMDKWHDRSGHIWNLRFAELIFRLSETIGILTFCFSFLFFSIDRGWL